MESSAVKWLYKACGRKKLYILALIIIQALNGASGVLYALFLRNIVDSAANKDKSGFVTAAVMIVVLVLVQVTFKALIRWLNELARAEIENIFKKRLLSQILKKDFSAVSAVHSGEWLNRLTNDTVVISQSCVEIFPGLIGMIVKMISALVMIVLLDYRFAFVFIPGGILMMIVTYGFRKVLKRLHKRIQESDGKLRVFLQERIGSLMIIRSFAAEKSTREQAEEKMSDHKKARMRRNYFANFSNIGFNIIMDGMYLFGVCYCGYGILMGRITYGTLTAITQLISQIQAPFANITGYLPKYYAMLASGERLMEIELFDDDIKQEPYDIQKITDIYHNELESFGLRDADFAYYASCSSIGALTKANMPKVLDNMSVELKKGEFVAFTGHSGCGKSTVLKLLMCIYRLDRGQRYLRLTPSKEEELSSLYHRLFAYVPQGNRLMSGTIRDVVCFAQPEDRHNDERIMNALRIACADEFVGELEEGVDTLLGERGTGLSEGQMQRIAVARAIYAGSPILLLDEATSALDENTEKQMLKNLREMTDKTVVIVTHRPAALDICDRVIEFNDEGVVG
ncbi:MAG: ABC transporter ATP-binding protein/permease [Ruminococcus sp.]|nr:ABC transporter ATP-binding protein/permease [Ruminococcus sp.]